MDPETITVLRGIIPPIARRAWDGDLNRSDGELPFTHDVYLKKFALTRPKLHADVILLDEAQDTNPCVEGMILNQASYGTQLVLVGDQYQELYGWRGATNSMRKFAGQPGVTVLSLTQSFRFGPAIAAAGNEWLTLLNAREKLSGWDQLQSTVGEFSVQVRGSRAILCRTNAEALKQALAELGAGRKVGLAGGVTELKALTLAAADLKNGKPVEHPELIGFRTWGALQDYVEHDPAGEDLKRFVDLVDEHGPDGLLQILIKIVKEDEADVVVSTVHKAKGLEWDLVRIAPDFRKPKQDPSLPEGRLPAIPRDLAMVAYVAVTRAQKQLDPAGLAWVADYLGCEPEAVEETEVIVEEAAVTVGDPFDVNSPVQVAFMADLIGAC
jgi:superfamily I DNA/RNA helicase